MSYSVLNGPTEGGPYNRLILQTESGEAWESNEDGDGDGDGEDSLDSVSSAETTGLGVRLA